MTEKWHRVTPRFSIGSTWTSFADGFVGLGITYYWTPRKRHHKVYIHLLVLRIVLAWHRRQSANTARLGPQVPGDAGQP